jgi:penicillin-binding protein 1A
VKRVLTAVLFLIFFALSSAKASPDYRDSLLPKFASTVYDRSGKVIGFFYSGQFRLYAPYRELPKKLIYAVITAEDERFFQHKGIDPLGIVRAAITDIAKGKVVQGGSTITQQLAKMIYLSPERTVERKLREMALARKLEEKLSKEEILELYLNYIYLSNGAYGVKAASWVLFGKENLSELTTAQCALLAGIIRGPEYYNPFKYPERALKRRNWVLKRMYQNGYISQKELQDALKEPLTPLKSPNYPRTAGYELDFIKFELLKKAKIRPEELYSKGLKIKTSIDSQIQSFAQRVLSQYQEKYSKTHKLDDLQCAGMAISRKGQLIFIVGGSDYRKTKLNRAFQALRPIGSTAKPFTYLTAFEKGWSPLDYVPNDPIEMPMEKFDPKTGERLWWKPENYERTFSPFLTLRQALMKSVNVATLHLALNFPHDIRKTLIRFELIRKDSPFDLSYVLGSFPSNLFRIVRAYSALQDNGILKEPYVVLKVRNLKGKVIYRGYPKVKKVAQPQPIQTLRSILQDVVKKGTAVSISYLTNYFDVAGKTGTTNDYRDTYFTGFTTSFTMSVWFGRDSYKTMWKGATGGGVAAPPWGKIALEMCKKYWCEKFIPPYQDVVESYPPPTHFPEEEMKELYYDELINSLGEENSKEVE